MDIQYCLECNNILYPRYENNILQLVCNKCNVVIDCDTHIIFNRYKNKNMENKNKKYFLNDVTLPKLKHLILTIYVHLVYMNGVMK